MKRIESKECRVAELIHEDIADLHYKIQTLNKIDQDKFLLKFMNIFSLKRKKVKEENFKKESVNVKYNIRKKGVKLLICAAYQACLRTDCLLENFILEGGHLKKIEEWIELL